METSACLDQQTLEAILTTLKRYAERKLTVWGADRRACLDRMRRALDETKISGLHTNLRLLCDVVNSAEFIDGSYQLTTRQNERAAEAAPDGSVQGCDLAIIAALLYEQRRRHPLPAQPERINRRWSRKEQKAAPDRTFLKSKDR